MKFLTLLLVALSSILAAMAYPYPMPDTPYAPPAPSYKPQPSYHEVGRVKIQAYRGPSEGKGYDVFAPWGFYVTQPKDAFFPYH